jgi:hypothetical protein
VGANAVLGGAWRRPRVPLSTPGTNATKASNTNGVFTELLRIMQYYSDLFLPLKIVRKIAVNILTQFPVLLTFPKTL